MSFLLVQAKMVVIGKSTFDEKHLTLTQNLQTIVHFSKQDSVLKPVNNIVNVIVQLVFLKATTSLRAVYFYRKSKLFRDDLEN